jgi:hypothetical protein
VACGSNGETEDSSGVSRGQGGHSQAAKAPQGLLLCQYCDV